MASVREAKQREVAPKAGGERSGWEVLKRVRAELGRDEASLTAAGIAFYSLLALPFLMGAGVSVYGMLADPATIERQLQSVSGALPQGASDLLTQQLRGAVSGAGGSLGLAFAIGLAGALWSGSAATKAIMSGCNVAYDAEERRGLLAYHGTALGLTAGLIVCGVLALAAVAVLPALLGSLGLGRAAELALQVLRWPLLLALIAIGLAVAYRYAPARAPGPWRWVTPGSLVATAAFGLGSVGFSVYVSYFGSYGEAYGALAGVVVAMLWLWIFGYAVVLGAELDAELARGAARESGAAAPG